MANNEELAKTIVTAIESKPQIVRLFNWSEISRTPGLPEWFIEKYSDRLNWPSLCRFQALSLDFINRHEAQIDYTSLVENVTIDDEVRSAKVDKMDWEKFQIHQPMSPAFLQKYQDTLSLPLVFKHQKLDQEAIIGLLSPYLEGKKYNALAGLLDIIFSHQTIDEGFVRFLLKLESEVTVQLPSVETTQTSKPRVTKFIFVNKALILKNQCHSCEFAEELMNSGGLDLYEIACKNQSLSPESSIRLLKEATVDPAIILEYQHVPVWAVVELLDSAKEQGSEIDKYLSLAAKYQNYSFEDFAELSRRASPSATNNIINILFLRTICTPSERPDVKLLQIDPYDLEEILLPLIDWDTISRADYYSSDQVEALVRKCPNICLYWIITNHHLSETLLAEITPSPIEWWAILKYSEIRGKDDPKYLYSESFWAQHGYRKKWWRCISEEERISIFTDCLESLNQLNNKKHLIRFMQDFAKHGEWDKLFITEKMDEFFIRLFSKVSNYIPMFWWKVSRYQTLTESFIRNHITDLDFNILLAYQILPESLLEEYIPFLESDGWDKIAKYQPLSEGFLAKYADHLDPKMLAMNVHLK
jgi:hypothetical protein